MSNIAEGELHFLHGTRRRVPVSRPGKERWKLPAKMMERCLETSLTPKLYSSKFLLTVWYGSDSLLDVGNVK